MSKTVIPGGGPSQHGGKSQGRFRVVKETIEIEIESFGQDDRLADFEVAARAELTKAGYGTSRLRRLWAAVLGLLTLIGTLLASVPFIRALLDHLQR